VDEGNTAVIVCHLPESQPKAQVRYSVKQEWLETSKGMDRSFCYRPILSPCLVCILSPSHFLPLSLSLYSTVINTFSLSLASSLSFAPPLFISLSLSLYLSLDYWNAVSIRAIWPIIKLQAIIWVMLKHGNTLVYFATIYFLSYLREKGPLCG
jgi:hypothetical protein